MGSSWFDAGWKRAPAQDTPPVAFRADMGRARKTLTLAAHVSASSGFAPARAQRVDRSGAGALRFPTVSRRSSRGIATLVLEHVAQALDRSSSRVGERRFR